MCASKARSLCTLSALFRSTLKPNTSKLETSYIPSSISESEDDFSELDSEPMFSSRHLLGVARASGSDSPKLVSKQISSILCENPHNQLSEQISSMLNDDQLVKRPDNDSKKLHSVLDLPWYPTTSHGIITQRQKEASRTRKQKWIFENTQENRFQRVVKFSARKLGTDTVLEVFGKLGKETSLKDYNALIGLCIKKARATNDEAAAVEEMGKAFHLFTLMREHGHQLQEQTYSPLLVYLIDMGMVEEFQFFSEVIKDENPSSLLRLGYYEMMLWLKVNNEEKIWELCKSIAVNGGEDPSGLGESYLLAFCEVDWKEGLLQLLEIIDITKLSSAESVAKIFKSLGRLLLESVAEKFLLAFKMCDHEADNTTNFIASYAVSIPNLAVEDVILKFKDLHQKLKVSPSSSSFEQLITYTCDLLEVHEALNLVDEMCKAGFTLSSEVLDYILRICEETCEYNLVHRVYSIICHNNLKVTNDTFRCMINLCIRMKDFEGAYKMLDDLEEMNLKPTSSMYNVIMAGYFREKNISGAVRVMEQMIDANVQPDSVTFSYLIGNSKTEEDITMHYEEMVQFGIQPTRQIFIALVNAYAACGLLEKAKKVVLDPAIPPKSLNDIKSVLVSALASHGQLSESTLVYDNIKKTGHKLEPKAAINLIVEHIQSDGKLDRLLLLLEELSDTDYWIDGCFRIIMFCVENKHLITAVDLIKQLNDEFPSDEVLMEVLLDQMFSTIASSESTHLKFGLDLFWVIRKDLGILPSRQCLDFLLTACANAKDLDNVRKIWKEYEIAGYPYNVLSFLRMYQALLASGDHKSARVIGNRIQRDDPHVCSVIQACNDTYIGSAVQGKLKKKGKKDDEA